MSSTVPLCLLQLRSSGVRFRIGFSQRKNGRKKKKNWETGRRMALKKKEFLRDERPILTLALNYHSRQVEKIWGKENRRKGMTWRCDWEGQPHLLGAGRVGLSPGRVQGGRMKCCSEGVPLRGVEGADNAGEKKRKGRIEVALSLSGGHRTRGNRKAPEPQSVQTEGSQKKKKGLGDGEK